MQTQSQNIERNVAYVSKNIPYAAKTMKYM